MHYSEVIFGRAVKQHSQQAHISAPENPPLVDDMQSKKSFDESQLWAGTSAGDSLVHLHPKPPEGSSLTTELLVLVNGYFVNGVNKDRCCLPELKYYSETILKYFF